MTLRVYVSTDKGKVRANQEDAYLVAGRLFAVFDGMGGMEHGEIAAAIARAAVQRAADDIDATRPGGRKWAIRHALAEADVEIGRTLAQAGGTTAVVLYVGQDGRSTVCHIGDSRAYLLRDHALVQLTHDHSYGGSVLSRSLSGRGHMLDYRDFVVQPGDTLLLCTDGLNGELTSDEIEAVLANPKGNPAKRLVNRVLLTPARDNVTVIVVRV